MDMSGTSDEFGFKDRPESYWTASVGNTNYPTLDKDIKVDVVIVGGGFVGITTASLLKQQNIRCAVLEANRIVQGTTGRTTAKITSQHGLIYSKLIKQFGKEKAQQYADANEYAINFIEELIKDKQIDCDFSRETAYLYTRSEKYIQQLNDEVEAASILGIDAAYLEDLPLPFKVLAAQRFSNQAQFHPCKFILALAREIPGDGSYIFEQTRAVKFQENNQCTVETDAGRKVTAEKMIITSHFPAYENTGDYSEKMYPEKSYALGMKIKEKFPGGMYISAEEPGRSLRSTPYEGGELIVAAGEHHKTGQGFDTNIYYKNLMDFARETYDSTEILFRWSAQDYTTLDDVPYVGNITSKSSNVYVATGFKKWGITHGTAAAIMFRDLIVQGENPWMPVYDPSRSQKKSGKNFGTANLDVAKNMKADKLITTPEEMNLEPGTAIIAEHDGRRIGIFKDQKGKVYAVKSGCTHLGCSLAWNEAELSWDCPCHGSRFTYDGKIIEGPALKSLKEYKV